MRKIVVSVAALVLIALVVVFAVTSRRGAADLEVGQITQESPQYPAGAIPYALSAKTFDLTASIVVTGCVDTSSGEEIHGITTLVVTPDVAIDPSQRYYMYFDSGTRAKNLDYTIELYDNGTLKSLTASIKDQVAPIAAAVTGSLVDVARAVIAGAGAGFTPPPAAETCKLLGAAIAKNPSDPRLTLRKEERWTPDPQGPGSYIVMADLERLSREFGLVKPHWAVSNALVALQPLASPAGEPPDIAFPKLDCPDGAKRCPRQRPPLVKGLVLRAAVPAILTTFVCDAACNAATLASGPLHDGLLTKTLSRLEMMPQFGARFLVPVHSGFAQDAAVEVAIDADGVITKLRTQSTSALAGSISTIGGQVASVVPKADDLQPSTASANRKLADCLSAQSAVRAAGGTPIGTCR